MTLVIELLLSEIASNQMLNFKLKVTKVRIHYREKLTKCIFFFQKLTDQAFELGYILLLALTKIHRLDLIEQLHQIYSSSNL